MRLGPGLRGLLQELFMLHLCQDCSMHLKMKSFNPHNNLLFPTFWMWEERSNLPKPTGLVNRAQPGRRAAEAKPLLSKACRPGCAESAPSLDNSVTSRPQRCLATQQHTAEQPSSPSVAATPMPALPRASRRGLLLLPALSLPAAPATCSCRAPVGKRRGHTSLRVTGSAQTFTEPTSAAAAKSLQLCLTLCDPMDCSLPGSSVHGIFQARVLEWVGIAFSSSMD